MEANNITRRRVLKAGAAAGVLAPSACGWRAAPQDAVMVDRADPFCGVYATLGRNEEEGCRMALGEINNAGCFVGRKIELLIEDRPLRPTSPEFSC